MYHSIIIDTSSTTDFNFIKSINTFDDWHLVPSSRPTIVNPPLKTSYLDIPGASGSVDATEWLTGFPTYGDREGEIEFIVLNDYGAWTQRRNTINRSLHGKKAKIMLEDEKDYYYIGRLTVDDWKSEKDWSKITLKYRLEPFKYSTESTTRWKWDPFNFENGIVLDSYYNIAVNSGNRATIKLSREVLPIQPSYCRIKVKNTNNAGLRVRLVNPELGIDISTVLHNGTVTLYEWLFSNLSGHNLVTISVTGVGSASFDVRFRSI